MDDCCTFREQIAIGYPTYGHALWIPDPGRGRKPVDVGDVGIIREGTFLRLFNALLPEGHPSNSDSQQSSSFPPQLQPRTSNYIRTERDGCEYFHSKSVIGKPRAHESGVHGSKPYDLQVTFSCSKRQGAILYLPLSAERRDTVARDDFARWMVSNIDKCLRVAEDLGLGVTHMEDIILVTGCHLAKSWVNITFSKRNQGDALVSFGVRRSEPSGVNFGECHVDGGDVKFGPQGENLPENQCIFVRGYRGVRILNTWPRLLGRVGPPRMRRGSVPGSDQRLQLIGIPNDAEAQDPLCILLEYIAEHTHGCDMALVHDDDLDCINSSSLETLQPDALIQLLRSHPPVIRQFQCKLLSGSKARSATEAIEIVATLSKVIFEEPQLSNLPHNNNESTNVLSLDTMGVTSVAALGQDSRTTRPRSVYVRHKRLSRGRQPHRIEESDERANSKSSSPSRVVPRSTPFWMRMPWSLLFRESRARSKETPIESSCPSDNEVGNTGQDEPNPSAAPHAPPFAPQPTNTKVQQTLPQPKSRLHRPGNNKNRAGGRKGVEHEATKSPTLEKKKQKRSTTAEEPKTRRGASSSSGYQSMPAEGVSSQTILPNPSPSNIQPGDVLGDKRSVAAPPQATSGVSSTRQALSRQNTTKSREMRSESSGESEPRLRPIPTLAHPSGENKATLSPNKQGHPGTSEEPRDLRRPSESPAITTSPSPLASSSGPLPTRHLPATSSDALPRHDLPTPCVDDARGPRDTSERPSNSRVALKASTSPPPASLDPLPVTSDPRAHPSRSMTFPLSSTDEQSTTKRAPPHKNFSLPTQVQMKHLLSTGNGTNTGQAPGALPKQKGLLARLFGRGGGH